MATVGTNAGIPGWRARRAIAGALALAACVAACSTTTPLEPVHPNQDPVVQSLTAFPTTLAPGDSAIVVCSVTDADGDRLQFGWSSDCRLLKKGNVLGSETLYNASRSLVVYAGKCNKAPVDTGWVTCEVWDDKGGFAYAGPIFIVVRQ